MDNPTAEGKTRGLWPLLGLAVLIGTGLRLYALGRHSLWLDEFATWHSTSRATLAEFWSVFTNSELTPPVFFAYQFGWARLLEQDEFGVRLPAAITGVLAIPAVFAFVSRVYDRWAGLLAALLFACAYQAIYFSQEARAYSLVMLLVALSGWTWFDLWRGKGRAWPYVAVATLLAYTHYFGAIFVFVQGLTAFSPRAWRKWLLAYGMIAALFLPWTFFIAGQMAVGDPATRVPGLGEVFLYHRWLFGRSSVYAALSALAIGWAVWKERRRMDFVLLAWTFLPFFVVALISQVRPIYADRYMAIGVVPMYALIGTCVARIPRHALAGAACAVFAGLGLYETILARHHYSEPKSEQVRESVEWVRDYLLKNPQAGVVAVNSRKPYVDYYFDRLALGRSSDAIVGSAEAVEQLRAGALRERNEVILLTPGNPSEDQADVAAFKAKYPLLDSKQLHRAGVWVFKLGVSDDRRSP